MLRAAAAGKGYATEAMAAAIDWFAANRGRQRIVCVVDPDNAASIRVAGKIGFVRYAERDYHDAPKYLFERPA